MQKMRQKIKKQNPDQSNPEIKPKKNERINIERKGTKKNSTKKVKGNSLKPINDFFSQFFSVFEVVFLSPVVVVFLCSSLLSAVDMSP